MSLTRVTYTAEREETLLGALDYFIDEGFGNQEELYREIAKYLGLQWGKSISRASIKAKVNHLWERCYGKGTPQNKKISLEGSSCLDLKKAVLGNNSSSSKIKRAKEQVRDNVQAWKQPRAIRAEGQTSTRTADVSGPQDGGGLRNDAGTAHDLGGGTEDAIMVDAEDPVSLESAQSPTHQGEASRTLSARKRIHVSSGRPANYPGESPRCNQCRKGHRRCDGSSPCTSCVQKGQAGTCSNSDQFGEAAAEDIANTHAEVEQTILLQSLAARDVQVSSLTATISSQQITIQTQLELLGRNYTEYENLQLNVTKLEAVQSDYKAVAVKLEAEYKKSLQQERLQTEKHKQKCNELEGKIYELYKENEELQRTNETNAKCWSSAQKSGFKEYDLGKSLQENVSLREEQKTLRGMLKFITTPIGSSQVRILDVREVKDEMENVLENVKATFAEFEGRLRQQPANYGSESDVIILVKRASRGCPRPKEAVSSTKTTTLNFGASEGMKLSMVAMAVMSAALQEWIFETNWPNFDAGDSDCLRVYRDQIASSQDGRELLRACDHAAYETLIDEPGFKKFRLLSKAKELSDRFKSIFFELCQSPIDRVRFETFEKDVQRVIQETAPLQPRAVPLSLM